MSKQPKGASPVSRPSKGAEAPAAARPGAKLRRADKAAEVGRAGWLRYLFKAENRTAVFGTGLLHLSIVCLFVFNWQPSPEPSKPAVKHIQASLLTASQVPYLEQQKQAAERKRKAALEKKQQQQRKAAEQRKKQQQAKAEQQRKKAQQALKIKQEKARKEAQRKEQERKERQHQEELKAQQEQARRALEQEELRRQEQRKQEEAALEKKRKEREQRLQQKLQERLDEQQQERLAQEQQAAESAARQAFELSETERFIAAIRERVMDRWRVPPGARGDLQVTLVLQLAPSGELLSVQTQSSSGLSAFDRSAEQAARAVNKYPVPSDTALFDKSFRRLSLVMRPIN